jgi:excisionase family DNA binding protein
VRCPWNDSLIELEDVRNQIADVREHQQILSAEQREEVLRLAEDLPRLWHSSSSSWKDKKRIIQLLIDDVMVERHPPNLATLHVRWQGGRCEDITVELPRKSSDRWRHSDEIVNRVRVLAKDFSDQEIAAKFNSEGLTTNKGNVFTAKSIGWIRHKHSLSAVDKKKAGELTVKEVSQQFGVSREVVYGLISEGLISARRVNCGSPYWITLTAESEKTVENRAKSEDRTSSR